MSYVGATPATSLNPRLTPPIAAAPLDPLSYSNPNNPTGALMEAARQREILGIAASVGAYVIADEVCGRGAPRPSRAASALRHGLAAGRACKEDCTLVLL